MGTRPKSVTCSPGGMTLMTWTLNKRLPVLILAFSCSFVRATEISANANGQSIDSIEIFAVGPDTLNAGTSPSKIRNRPQYHFVAEQPFHPDAIRAVIDWLQPVELTKFDVTLRLSSPASWQDILIVVDIHTRDGRTASYYANLQYIYDGEGARRRPTSCSFLRTYIELVSFGVVSKPNQIVLDECEKSTSPDYKPPARLEP